jgi:glycosyltransferase involved in cell wall biosynthesis
MGRETDAKRLGVDGNVPQTPTGPDPRVSIIIPAYNTAQLIAECLDSVFAQTYKDFEAIVVNDGSPDTPDLEKVLEPYRKRIVYIEQKNKRAAGARNTAIRAARGEFLALLDSDDRWFPDHLEAQMKLFAEDSSLDMVYANGWTQRGKRRVQYMEVCPSKGPATFEALVFERCQVAISTVVVRKSSIVRAGLFDESILRCDDYDMWLRTAFYGAKIGYSRKPQAYFDNGRQGSLGQSSLKMAEAYWQILERLSRTLPLNDADRQMVGKRIAQARAFYLLEEGKFQLYERQYDNARQALAEANEQLRSPKLTLALVGLKLAPSAVARLSTWRARILERLAN